MHGVAPPWCDRDHTPSVAQRHRAPWWTLHRRRVAGNLCAAGPSRTRDAASMSDGRVANGAASISMHTSPHSRGGRRRRLAIVCGLPSSERRVDSAPARWTLSQAHARLRRRRSRGRQLTESWTSRSRRKINLPATDRDGATRRPTRSTKQNGPRGPEILRSLAEGAGFEPAVGY